MSASSQSLRFIFSLRMNSSFITSRPEIQSKQGIQLSLSLSLPLSLSCEMIAKLERTPSTILQNKDKTQPPQTSRAIMNKQKQNHRFKTDSSGRHWTVDLINFTGQFFVPDSDVVKNTVELARRLSNLCNVSSQGNNQMSHDT